MGGDEGVIAIAEPSQQVVVRTRCGVQSGSVPRRHVQRVLVALWAGPASNSLSLCAQVHRQRNWNVVVSIPEPAGALVQRRRQRTVPDQIFDSRTSAIMAPVSPPYPSDLPQDVLIVEDDPIIALDLEDTILGFGVTTVRTAANVVRALQMIADRAPEFALLDVGLDPRSQLRDCRRTRGPEYSVRLRHRIWHGSGAGSLRGPSAVAKALFKGGARGGAQVPPEQRPGRPRPD